MTIDLTPAVQNLQNARLKIEWAKGHINAVKDHVEAVIKDNRDVIRIQTDTNTGKALIQIGPKNTLPVGLVMHLGDAVHNLNSVMDFIWSGLARSVSTELASKITFPRHETRQNLQAQIQNPKGYNALIHQAFPQAEAFILDTVKPYNAGDGSFVWQMNKLDNINKHRTILAAPCIMRFDKEIIFEGSDGGTFVHKAGINIKTYGYPLSVGLAAPVKVSNDPVPTVNVVIDEVDILTDQPVLETLVDFSNAATKVCQKFEETFLI